LETLWRGIMGMRGGYVYEVDIRKFFDTLDHGHLRSFLRFDNRKFPHPERRKFHHLVASLRPA
jgi:retron-type reverse transcriptase